MGHFVNALEIVELCAELGLHAEEQLLIEATDRAAKAIARTLGVQALHTDNQPGFGGLCANFGSAYEGQRCPKKIAYYDSQSDWAQAEPS